MKNEADTRSYRLISGVFYPEEASQLLMTLIEDKISFHQRQHRDYSEPGLGYRTCRRYSPRRCLRWQGSVCRSDSSCRAEVPGEPATPWDPAATR